MIVITRIIFYINILGIVNFKLSKGMNLGKRISMRNSIRKGSGDYVEPSEALKTSHFMKYFGDREE